MIKSYYEDNVVCTFQSWQAGLRRYCGPKEEIMEVLHKLIVPAHRNAKKAGTFVGELLTQLKDIENQSARVYRTYPPRDDFRQKYFVFSTTSKDVHLLFGLLGSEGQYYLSRMLDEESRLAMCSELLLCLKQDMSPNKGTMLVTKTVEKKGIITFTFSPAH